MELLFYVSSMNLSFVNQGINPAGFYINARCFRLTLQRKYGRPQSFCVPKKIFIFSSKNICFSQKG